MHRRRFLTFLGSAPFWPRPAAGCTPDTLWQRGDLLLAAGDELTHGGGRLRSHETWPGWFEWYTAPSVYVHNSAERRATTETVLGRIVHQIETHEPRVIVLTVGRNDEVDIRRNRKTLSDVREALNAIGVAASERGVPLCLLGHPAYVGASHTHPTYEGVFDQVERAHVDHTILPHLFADRELRIGNDQLSPQGMHQLARYLLRQFGF